MVNIFTGGILPGVLIIWASYFECETTPVLLLICLSISFLGAFHAGVKINNIDLSPNYTGSITALTNSFGALTGIVVPYLVGYLTPNVNHMLFI